MPILYVDNKDPHAVPTSKEEIDALKKHYLETLPGSSNGDALCSWVSIKEVYALIVGNPGATGIMIYYGRHPDGVTIKGKDYGNKHCVILVTTEDQVDQNNPSIENYKDILVSGKSLVSYTGNGDDNIPTKPPY